MRRLFPGEGGGVGGWHHRTCRPAVSGGRSRTWTLRSRLALRQGQRCLRPNHPAQRAERRSVACFVKLIKLVQPANRNLSCRATNGSLFQATGLSYRHEASRDLCDAFKILFMRCHRMGFHHGRTQATLYFGKENIDTTSPCTATCMYEADQQPFQR